MNEAEPNLNVLVAEDNSMNQRLIQQLLKSFGFRCTIVNDGQEALDALEKNPLSFQIVLMDLHMPVIDGYMATKTIREGEAAFKDIPIFGLSAHTAEEVIDEILEAGMNGYISKPIEIPTLLSTLNQYVSS